VGGPPGPPFGREASVPPSPSTARSAARRSNLKTLPVHLWVEPRPFTGGHSAFLAAISLSNNAEPPGVSIASAHKKNLA